MPWLYFAFNVIVLLAPLIGIFLWQHDFWQRWRRLLLAWATVSVAWIGLDAFSVTQGWWSYNSSYILGPRVWGLPAEEIAFFFTVPFASMAAWHVLHSAMPQQQYSGTRAPIGLLVIALALSGAAIWWADRPRTLFDCLIAIATVVALAGSQLVRLRAFWHWNLLILVACGLFNTILTAAPVVWYSQAAMSGVRIGTIPLEDFIYNFSLLNLFLLVMVGRKARR
jgi:lycopene cyclase domain-containing protein